MKATILQGDVMERLRELPDASVQCVVTSPPYWGLRDYGCEGQLGLERTPDEYIAKMVEVFREVKRVLRDDGTLWLNIGDSYAASPGQRKSTDAAGPKQRTNMGAQGAPSRSADNLKPKDLVGIPWALAKALRDPHYTGRIKDERDRVWMAAIIDAEGCICGFTHERKDDGSIRTGINITITNSSMAMLEHATAIWPSRLFQHNDHGDGHLGILDTWRWGINGTENRIQFLREIFPYLIVKRRQAILAYSLLLLVRDAKKLGHSSQAEATKEKRALLVALLSDANKSRPVELPSWCEEPPSMYEPGWYLRQDIIWHKPNPMPESVRDRCTKAHEYIFLLSKSERYYYSFDAVKEDCTADHPAGNNTHKGLTAYEDGDDHHRTKQGLVAFAQKTRKVKVPGGWDVAAGSHGTIHRDGPTEATYRELGEKGASADSAEVRSGKGAAFGRGAGWRDDPTTTPDKRNKRSVWTVATEPFPEAHFATFPTELIKPCILAGCPEDAPVLDPFSGSGTTGVVALRLNRQYIGIELKPEYVEMSNRRICGDAPLLNTVEVSTFEEAAS